MKKSNILNVVIAAVLSGLAIGSVVVLYLFAPTYLVPAVALWALIAIALTVSEMLSRWHTARRLRLVARRLDPASREALEVFPIPAMLVSKDGQVLYYNNLFALQVMYADEKSSGLTLSSVFPGCSPEELSTNITLDVRHGDRMFTAYIASFREDGNVRYVLYLCDDTSLKNIAAEYDASRPVLLNFYIDNLEEATRDMRDGDRARIGGQVETMLEDWMSAYGILQKVSAERFLAVTESRHLETITKNRFDILDTIRKAFPEVEGGITLSIGVGQGQDIEECRQMSRQALEMALSRGGDQAAVKTVNGYDFYGGQSKGVERRTKVRTRMVANSLRELIRGSEQVMVLGHRLSDLDCLGSGAALAMASRSLGVPAHVIVRSGATMAGQIIQRYKEAGYFDLFLEPDDATERMEKNTLLIVTDTHAVPMLDAPDFYKLADRVVVIDHHRRMVNYIQDAVLTYHEPTSSSASELVTELLPYLMTDKPTKLEAEVLLAGIMLDTRNFVMRTGVRTFEAAAYLRGLGADTVSVKKMFAESLDMYQLKNDLVAQAKVYRGTAITVSTENLSNRRTAAAQAADDLLSVQGVQASFVLCPMGNEINISARSFGEINVQLIMESLGGGGHQTMAATQLKETTVEEAESKLKKAIDAYLQEHTD